MTEKYLEDEDVLLQYGTPRHSGRYPWGSGKDPQRNQDFLSESDRIKEKLRKSGVGPGQLGSATAKEMGMSTTEYRTRVTWANEERQRQIFKEVKTRMDRGEDINSVASAMSISPGSVRNYASKDPNTVSTKKQTDAIGDALKKGVNKTGYLDVGVGVERQLGISQPKMNAAVEKLRAEGYYVFNTKIDQLTSNTNQTTMKVLTKDDNYGSVMRNIHKVRPIDFVAVDGDGMTLQNLQTPKSLNSSRVKIRYAIPKGQAGHGGLDDGQQMDGSMIIRPSAKDLQFGANKHYAQVRIAVDGTHYLKGVALYGNEKDFPKGVDVIFNTNKTKDVPMTHPDKNHPQVLKQLKDNIDGANPFGATIKRQNDLLDDKGLPVQLKDKDGKPVFDKKGNPMHEAGALNIVNEEGDWADWTKSLSAQFLSKQPRPVIKERLDATLKRVDKDYDDIEKVTNPVIKKQLLESYSSDLESKQVHLKAVAPKGFQGHLILPIPDMKENEIYAPNYKDGDNVILIRYPHGGTFEIPELRVNNNGPGKHVVGPDSPDAVGIHPKVAAKLSGADFDGDTVYVIPNNSHKYKSRSALEELKDFDPNKYADEPGTFKPITKKGKQTQMGMVSNLITDMTLQHASDEEMARAVKHSMVVIDSEKHKLNYKRSELDNGIDSLKKKYQVHIDKVDYKNLKVDDPSRYESEIGPDGKPHTKIDENGNKVHRKITPIDEEELNTLGFMKTKTGASSVISRHKQGITTGGKPFEYNKVIKPGEPGNVTAVNKLKRQLAKGDITQAQYDLAYSKIPNVIQKKTGVARRNKSYVINMLEDASSLLNDNSTQVEKDYVDYINEIKSRKNKVDSEIDKIKPASRDPKASLIYGDQVASLDRKLSVAELNAPKERQAQLLATKNYNKEVERLGGSDSLDKDDLKKLRNQALVGARNAVGASRHPVVITDDEWDAIQSNAISANKLSKLVKNMDDEQLKELATPRASKAVSEVRKNKAIAMLSNGYTTAQIAEVLGVSPSQVSAIRKEAGISTTTDRLKQSRLPIRPQDAELLDAPYIKEVDL